MAIVLRIVSLVGAKAICRGSGQTIVEGYSVTNKEPHITPSMRQLDDWELRVRRDIDICMDNLERRFMPGLWKWVEGKPVDIKLDFREKLK